MLTYTQWESKPVSLCMKAAVLALFCFRKRPMEVQDTTFLEHQVRERQPVPQPHPINH